MIEYFSFEFTIKPKCLPLFRAGIFIRQFNQVRLNIPPSSLSRRLRASGRVRRRHKERLRGRFGFV